MKSSNLIKKFAIKDNVEYTAQQLPKNPYKINSINYFSRNIIFKLFNKLHYGSLIIDDIDQQYYFGKSQNNTELCVKITISNPTIYRTILTRGSIGAAESYISNDWDSSNLTDVIRLMVRNLDQLDKMEQGSTKIIQQCWRFIHRLKRNTIKGSKKNITAHYDLSNDFFHQFLDQTMMYSSAIFPTSETTLEHASINKLDIICKKLKLAPNDRLIEIGSGWGSMAVHAAKYYGCKVTTTTISKAQYDYAAKKIKDEKLESKITLLFEDYRHLTGQYDKLVSIEMIEAVGHRFYNIFFNHCAQLLKPNGLMLLQSITISDQRYEQAKHAVDFIQKYIFPGSCIPSITAISTAIKNASDMNIIALEDIGQHYAKTISIWRENFNANRSNINKLGFNLKFQKMWLFYLAYCEGGFLERSISDVHLLIAKPLYKPTV